MFAKISTIILVAVFFCMSLCGCGGEQKVNIIETTSATDVTENLELKTVTAGENVGPTETRPNKIWPTEPSEIAVITEPVQITTESKINISTDGSLSATQTTIPQPSETVLIHEEGATANYGGETPED